MTITRIITFDENDVADYECFKKKLIEEGYILNETTTGCTAILKQFLLVR